MAQVGTASLNFGAIGSPSSNASVAVTGQTGISANAYVEAWIRLVATAEHDIDEVQYETLRITAGTIVAGTGFTIYGEVLNGKTYGNFTVNWVWMN